MTFILVTAGSVVFFHEGVSTFKALGIMIILAGIWIVAKK
jgi:drug/metabolite transporter (DMT)-like permease